MKPRKPAGPRRKLTHKARKFLKHILAGDSPSDAVIKAGYSPKNPTQSANQVLNSCRKTVPQLLNEAGLSESALISAYLSPLLKATQTRFFHHKGKVKAVREVAALETRTTALEMAFKLHGSFAPLKQETTSRSVSVIVLDVPRPGKTVGEAPAVIDLKKPAGTNGNGNGNGANGNGSHG